MRTAGHSYPIMDADEIDLIVGGALRILNDMGMEIQNQPILSHFAAHGWPVDFKASRVRFPENKVIDYLRLMGRYQWANHIPHISSSAGVYHGRYLNPFEGTYENWTEKTLSTYFGLAKSLSMISGASMLGCQIPVPPFVEPLYERYYCWKYGASECGSIYLDRLCPYIHEIYNVRASALAIPIEEVFTANVFVIPHLKLGQHEAYQVQYFWERGLKVSIGGGMPSMGGTAPVTLAGAVTLNLAEQIALNLTHWVLFATSGLHIESSISVLDMRTRIHPFGRPEMVMTNLMTAQLARYLGATFSGHAGLTDAKAPSTEAGAQKMMTAIPTLLAGGSLWLDAGLLSADEVYSPIQMILDNEMLRALNHLTTTFSMNDEALSLDTIFNVGPGGHYMDQSQTVNYFRDTLWQPTIWSQQMFQSWSADGSYMDSDYARDYFQDFLTTQNDTSTMMSEDEEQAILKIINQAKTKI
ncbi:MAG: trimethylamine methyltransferase family protein [Anaerolineae bacterium]|nr:trimethylamine methyltransferase family protein [Anaerolineae bacterium]